MHVVSWDEILERLDEHPEVLRAHFGFAAPIAAPAQAEALPPHYVPRPAETDRVLRQLCTNDPAPLLAISALHGMGGIGKSTLARAVAHSPLTQEHFQDGVLWATLGQQPDVLSKLTQWIAALGDRESHPTSVEAASNHLRTMLHGKAVLLVIDDAWSSDDVRPLLPSGDRAAVLITTRRADVADEVGASLFQLDVMQPNQALALLSSCLRRDLGAKEAAVARAVAAAVGYSPLALELAAARVRRGVPWERLREALEREVARLEELEGVRRRRGGAPARLEASLNLSLRALRDEDESAWASFVALGVLPEDVVIAAPLTSVLWRTSEETADDLLELLWGDALLMAAPPTLIGGRSRITYRLHDLLHDVARRRLGAPHPAGLGFSLPAAHGALVDSYEAACKKGLLQNLPEDGYIHEHIAWHLEKAGRVDRLHLLLREVNAEGCNAWYAVRQRMGQFTGYMADIGRASRLCDVEEGSNRPVELGHRSFYAGVMATLVSLAATIPPGLISALLRNGVWSAAQTLTHLRQTPRSQRTAAVLSVIPLLPEATLVELLGLVRNVDDDRRAKVLIALAARANDELLATILEEARELRSETEKLRVLWSVFARLPPNLLADGLGAVAEIGHLELRLLALGPIISRVPNDLLGSVVDLLADHEDEDWELWSFEIHELAAFLINDLAPRLSPDLRHRVAKFVHKIEDQWDRPIAILSLAAASTGLEDLHRLGNDRPWLKLIEGSGLRSLVTTMVDGGVDDWANGILAIPLRGWFDRVAAARTCDVLSRAENDIRSVTDIESAPGAAIASIDAAVAAVVLPWLAPQRVSSSVRHLCVRQDGLIAALLPAVFPYLSPGSRGEAIDEACKLTSRSLRVQTLMEMHRRAPERRSAEMVASALRSQKPSRQALFELAVKAAPRSLGILKELSEDG